MFVEFKVSKNNHNNKKNNYLCHKFIIFTAKSFEVGKFFTCSLSFFYFLNFF